MPEHKLSQNQIEQYKLAMMIEMAKHRGRANIIGMGELYRRVFGRDWSHRINDTRPLRTIVSMLRTQGVPICSTTSGTGGGYYLADADELNEYCVKIRRKALKELAQEARLRRIALPELLGQIQLTMMG